MSEFRVVTLGEVVEETGGRIQTGPFGTVLRASEYTPSGVPVISVGEIGYGRLKVDAETPRVDSSLTSRLPEYVLHGGDIVFARKGAVDRVAWVTPEQGGWFLGSDGIMVRIGDAVNSQFLAYQLQGQRCRRWLLQHAAGSTMASLNQRVLSKLPIAIPERPTQHAIAEVLGALDDKISSNSALAKTADELARALFSESVRGVDVSDRTFDDVASVGGGGTPSSKVPEYWSGNINWATPTDVTALEGPYLFDTERRISEVGLANCSSPLYPAGSILMTSRATIGAFALAQEATAVNQGFIVVVPGGDVPAMWLFHEMRSRVPEFTSMANGATFLELSRGNFKKFGVRLAEPEVMARFDERARALHDRAAAALKENTRLKVTRDALLPGLMSGKLRVRDAERVAEEVA